ncbi:MAG: penicillin-binding protein 1B [Pseudomonadota bacterium]
MSALRRLASPFLWIKRHFLKLAILSLAIVVGYLWYIDNQVKERFAGNKWEVPAQIYARPLVLSLNLEIGINEIIDELELLGYRKMSSANHVGEYSVTPSSLTIKRRAFTYADLIATERTVEVHWKDQRIEKLILPDTKQKARRIMLEPWLISRLVGGLSEDRMLVTESEIPDFLKLALIQVEDKDFYSHHGVAPLAIVRALIANIAAGSKVQGGSTLTQQLVKNLYLTSEKSYIRKLREAAMAIVIDARYSKQDILDAYINEVFLGQNGAIAVHGFGLASHFFFNKPLIELEIHEIATLVGMIKGPSLYNPIRHPERTKERRNLVLRVLFEANYLATDEYQNAIAEPIAIVSSPSLASGKHPAFMDKVKQELDNVVDAPDLRDAGVKVYTTMDINVQRRAEKALKKVLQQKQNDKMPDLESAMLVTDIKSGGIRAIIGGKKTTFAGFNRALNAQRQVGSLIKPLVYLNALEQPNTYNLATPLVDEPIEFDDEGSTKWRPQNADKIFRGQVNLVDALTKSYNVPTVNLAMELGMENIVESMHRLGAMKLAEPLPSFALGAVNLTPLQVNQVYQSIANNGEYRPLHALSAVSTFDDQLVWMREEEYTQVADSDAIYLLNYALHKVTRDGTAKAIGKAFPKVSMAGKTGTTDDYRDSWFTGFDRNLLSTVWVGNDNNKPINMSGASGALPIFIEFQKQQTPKNLSRRFPESLIIAHFNAQNGQQTTPGCGNVLSVPAIRSGLDDMVTCQNQLFPLSEPKPKDKKNWFERLFGL